MDYRSALIQKLSGMFLNSLKYRYRAPHLQIAVRESDERIEVKYPLYMDIDIQETVKKLLLNYGCSHTKLAFTENDYYGGVVGFKHKTILPKESDSPESKVLFAEPNAKKLTFEENREQLDDIAALVAHKKCLEDKKFFDFDTLEEKVIIDRIKEEYPEVDAKAAAYIYQKAKFLLKKTTPKVAVTESVEVKKMNKQLVEKLDKIEAKLTELYASKKQIEEDIALLETHLDEIADEVEGDEDIEKELKKAEPVVADKPEAAIELSPDTKTGAMAKIVAMYDDGMLTADEFKKYMQIQLAKVKK